MADSTDCFPKTALPDGHDSTGPVTHQHPVPGEHVSFGWSVRSLGMDDTTAILWPNRFGSKPQPSNTVTNTFSLAFGTGSLEDR